MIFMVSFRRREDTFKKSSKPVYLSISGFKSS